jgi:hypothetical protein
VNIFHVERIEGPTLFVHKAALPISASYRSELLERLNLL